MPIALGAMPEPTTGAKSRLLHAGAMPTLDAFLFSSPAFWFFPPFSSHAFEFFLVLPYKNKVFSFFSFFSSFWAIPPARRAATRAGCGSQRGPPPPHIFKNADAGVNLLTSLPAFSWGGGSTVRIGLQETFAHNCFLA